MFDDNQLSPCGESMTLLINEHCRRIEREGTEVVRFGFGQSPFPPMPEAVAEMQKHAARKEYAPVQGLPELRDAVAAFHSATDGRQWTGADVFIGPGSKQLIINLMHCFKTLNVYIPAPAWVSYHPQADIARQPVVRIAAKAPKWRVTAAELDAAFTEQIPAPGAPKLLILNNPGNPDGCTHDRAELEEIAAVCEKHNVLVLADEIYGLLDHEGTHTSFASLYERTILLTGLSKWFGAGGWRIGAFLFPKNTDALRTVFAGIASETYSCVSTPVQLAAVVAYTCPGRDEYLRRQRLCLRTFGRWAARSLREAGVDVADPTGAFYLFVDFDRLCTPRVREQLGVKTSNEFFRAMLADTHVALLGGIAFGMPAEHFCARLAYVTFDGAHALASAANRTAISDADAEEFVKSVAPKVHHGVTAICAFAKKLAAMQQ